MFTVPIIPEFLYEINHPDAPLDIKHLRTTTTTTTTTTVAPICPCPCQNRSDALNETALSDTGNK